MNGMPAPRRSKIDPVTLEVLRHRLWEMNNEMGLLAARMSGSHIVYEAGDFNAALLTREGKGLFSGAYMIRMATTLDLVVQSVRNLFADDIHEGDAFMTTDPWHGALHAMDAALVMPVFSEGEVIAWTGVVFHEVDMGGPRPGSWAVGARTSFEECPLIPPVKIYERGKLRADVERMYLRNVRMPEMNALNLRAKFSAQAMTAERLREIVREVGQETFLELQTEILEYVRSTVRQRLRKLPDGTWYASTFVEHDGVDPRLYRVKLAMTKKDDRLLLDFTGTDRQAQGAVNCAYSGLLAGILQVMLPLLCFDVPWAHGAAMDCFDVLSEPSTINNASFPAGTSMATVNACQATADTVWEAMSRMLGCSAELQQERCALGYGQVNLAIMNGQACGVRFVNIFADCGGGTGARSYADGLDAGGPLHAPGFSIPNAERTESVAPVILLYRKQRAGTGGPGTYRGGLGMEVQMAPYGVDGDMESVYISGAVSHPSAKGLSGGYPGSVQRNLVLRNVDAIALLKTGRLYESLAETPHSGIDVPNAKDVGRLGPRDVWLTYSMGGGGYGDPLDRALGRLEADVRHGLCTREEAERAYGAVFADGAIDPKATEARRAARRRERLASGKRLGERYGEGPCDGPVVRPVGNVLAVRKAGREQVIGCVRCNTVLCAANEDPRLRAVMLQTPVAEFCELNAFVHHRDVVVREYACPGCGVLFSTDVQLESDDPRSPEMHLVS